MSALLTVEADLDTEVFPTLEGVEMPSQSKSWSRETRLDLLAWEIARYEPALAEQLAAAGRRRLVAERV